MDRDSIERGRAHSREHDHIVEPLFAALGRAPADGGAGGDALVERGRGRARVLAGVLLACLAATAAAWWLA